MAGLDVVNRLRIALDRYVEGLTELKTGIIASLLSGVDLLIVSPPGEAKTYSICLLSRLIDGCRLFRKMMFYDMSRFDIVGYPRIVERIIDGERVLDVVPDWASGVAEANIALFDEIFKAPGPVAMLIYDILAHRVIEWRGNVYHLENLWVVYGLSNIDDIEEKKSSSDPVFRPLFDRFSARLWMGRTSLEKYYDIIDRVYRNSDEFRKIHVEPVVTREDIVRVRREVSEFTRKNLEHVKRIVVGVASVAKRLNIDVSPRRVVQLVQYAGALLYMGLLDATVQLYLAHCVADSADDAEKIRSNISISEKDIVLKNQIEYLISIIQRKLVNYDTVGLGELLNELEKLVNELPEDGRRIFMEHVKTLRSAYRQLMKKK